MDTREVWIAAADIFHAMFQPRVTQRGVVAVERLHFSYSRRRRGAKRTSIRTQRSDKRSLIVIK